MDRLKAFGKANKLVVDHNSFQGFRGVMSGNKVSVVIERKQTLLVFWPDKCPSLQFIFDTYGT